MITSIKLKGDYKMSVYNPSNYRKLKDKTKVINHPLNPYLVESLISYTLTDDLTETNYKSVKDLLDLVEKKYYDSQPESYKQIQAVKKGLDARLNGGVTDINLIKSAMAEGYGDKFDQLFSSVHTLSENDINEINKQVADEYERSDYNAIEYKIQRATDVITGSSQDDPSEVFNDLNASIEEINERKAKTVSNADILSGMIMPMDQEASRNYYEQYHERSNRPTACLKTGIEALNEFMRGGLYPTKVYSLFGIQGRGKSITLLDLAIQAKRYNEYYVCKDPSKKPMIVYLSLENTYDETEERKFTMVNRTTHAMKEYDPSEVMRMMNKNFPTNEDSNNISLCIKYEEANSITTSWIYSLYNALDKAGYELIALFVDYLALIEPELPPSQRAYAISEERFRLESSMVQLKVAATKLDIPIVTAGQLNRNANMIIEQAQAMNNPDPVSLLNLSHIAESMGIANKMDMGIIICPVIFDGRKYLGMNMIKSRYTTLSPKITHGKSSFYQPYASVGSKDDVNGNNLLSIKLLEDVNKRTSHFLISFEPTLNQSAKPKTVIDENVEVPDNSKRGPQTIVSPTVCTAIKPNLKSAPPKLPKGHEMVNVGNCFGAVFFTTEYDERVDFETTYKTDVTQVVRKVNFNINDYAQHLQNFVTKKVNELHKFKDAQGNVYDFNPNWRNEPRVVNGEINYDSFSPEMQRRYWDYKEYAALHETDIDFMNYTPVSYKKYMDDYYFSDAYTKNYDPYGSKEERLVRCYNMIHAENNTINDYWWINQHRQAFKRGEIKMNEKLDMYNAFVPATKKNAFIKMENHHEAEAILHSPEYVGIMNRMFQ